MCKLIRYTLGAALALTLATPAMTEEPNQALLEELRTLAQESRDKRAADRWLQRALDDLIARYDWPWQNTLLYEDFSDGDFSHNPSWQLLEGHFEVRPNQGLLAYSDRYAYRNGGDGQAPQQKPQSTEDALSSLIIGALLDQAMDKREQQANNGQRPAQNGYPRTAGPNRLRVKAGVSNAFALTLTFRLGEQPSELGLVLLQSEQARYGYRLQLHNGARGFVELQRIRYGRGAIVESQSLPLNLHDGRLHDLVWNQSPDGLVTVAIDGQTVFQVRDRAFRDGYPWLQLDHLGGDLAVRALRVDGT